MALNDEIRRKLKQMQQALNLHDHDVNAINGRQQLAYYQQNLMVYQQMLLEKLKQQAQLSDRDQQELDAVRQVLKILPADAHVIHERIAQQLGQPPQPLPYAQTFIPEGSGIANPSVAPDPSVPFYPEAAGADQTMAMTPTQMKVFQAKMNKDRASQGLAQQPRSISIPDLNDPRATQLPQESTSTRAEGSAPIKSGSQADQGSSPSKLRTVLLPVVLPIALLAAAAIGALIAFSSSSNSLFSGFNKPPADPAAAQSLADSGIAKTQEQQYQAAIDEFTQAIKRDPQAAAINHVNRGYAYEKMGRLSAALDDYNQAIQSDPNRAEAYSNRSHIYYTQERYDDALADADKALQLDPSLAGAYVNRANARAAKGDSNGALEDYSQAILLTSLPAHQAVAHNDRGNIWLLQNNLTAAIADYRRSIQLNPGYADAHRNLAIALQKQDSFDQAKQSFDRALTLFKQQNNASMVKQVEADLNALQDAEPTQTEETDI